jgi:hypothetical protein
MQLVLGYLGVINGVVLSPAIVVMVSLHVVVYNRRILSCISLSLSNCDIDIDAII